MPISINELLANAGIKNPSVRTVKWNCQINSSSIGIYLVSTSLNPALNDNHYDKPPISNKILDFWIKKVPSISIDKVLANTESLKQRLSSFWIPDENILYIGQTESKKGLKNRINQYYNTELGDSKPHAGGHWIKTLSILDNLYVHYIAIQNPKDIEHKLLEIFKNQVSKESIEKLFDKNLPIPFANLEIDKSCRKNHGISKSKLDD